MCGIAGKLLFDTQASVDSALLKKMSDMIVHRGPDDDGYYQSGPVGFAFRRLSIIDLALGHQPISNEDGKVWLIFNGEIYNYQDLRRDLLAKGHTFRTQSDTEVIVHLYEEFGEDCFAMLRGMFAIAIWDDRNKTLVLARDRFGIKPLYYWSGKKSLIFGSEIKSILADPETDAEVLPGLIDRFLTFNYVPGEETLFKNIYKLAPAHYMTVRNGSLTIKQYWDLRFTPSYKTQQQAENELAEILEESVRLHMISDVPVGFLLSGGVDSTAMLGLAVGKTEHSLSSYTLGFSAPGITDERPYAQLAAKTYGSQHHEMTISSSDFRDFMPQYVWHMEEPVVEPPAIALYFVSRLASQFVKVLISGEGGDEAFAGYPNYRNMLWMERLKSVAGPLTPLLASCASFLNRHILHSDGLTRYLPLMNMPFESYYYSRTSGPLNFFNSKFRDFYTSDFSRQVNKEFSTAPATRLFSGDIRRQKLNRMLYVDTKTWLTDDLLLKADKMTMANSVELRVPLLDHKVLEFAASLPENLKVHGLTTKYIAKKTLEKRVPAEILNRKKTGFPVPYSEWMRKDLKDWVYDIVLDRRTVQRGYFDRKAVQNLLDENLRSGKYPKEVFSLVTLELWHRSFLGTAS